MSPDLSYTPSTAPAGAGVRAAAGAQLVPAQERTLQDATSRNAAPTAESTADVRVVAYEALRRVLDVAVASVLLVLLAPIVVLIGLVVYADSGLPIIYRCERLGRHGSSITVLKFRTMGNGSHQHLDEFLSASDERRLEYQVSRKLRDDPRRTRIGRFLRRSSLDELPQLLNVILGDMSLVGPRPYMPGELFGRSEAEELLSLRPGVTGLWQVNGRSNRTFEERLAMEVDYVRRRSALLDFSILLRTVWAVVSGRGAY